MLKLLKMGVGSVKMIKTKWLWTLRNGKNKLNFFVKKSCYLTIFIIVYLGGEKYGLFLVFFFIYLCRHNRPCYFGQAFNGLDKLVINTCKNNIFKKYYKNISKKILQY